MTSVMMMELLDFEEQWPRWSSRKDESIRARFGVPPARYFQLVLARDRHGCCARGAAHARTSAAPRS